MRGVGVSRARRWLGAAALAGSLALTFEAAAEPTVLRFAPNTITLRTQGRMTPASHEHRYSINVRKGQTLTFNFEGAGPLIGEVDCNGGYLGPFSDGDQFVVPESGPCILTIEISRMAERWTGSYRLAVTAK